MATDLEQMEDYEDAEYKHALGCDEEPVKEGKLIVRCPVCEYILSDALLPTKLTCSKCGYIL